MHIRYVVLTAVVAGALAPIRATSQDVEPYLGRWALTLPDGRAGWLGVSQEDNYLDASILWGGGSVVPVASAWVWEYMSGDTLWVVRLHDVERKDETGTVIRTQTYPEILTFHIDSETGDLKCDRLQPRRNGIGARTEQFTGVRIPDLPDPPDLNRIEYGDPIELFNGKNLDGWELTNPRQTNGWMAKDGVLHNDATKEGVSYGNLRTTEEFEDFNLTLEVKVPEGGNSGVYCRGIYEVQVLDSYGMDLDSHHMGAIYSRITPSVAAEKPAGEWQTLDITLVDRHITVKLNGVTTIDNEPLLGCTGGALWSDEFRPGPIYLQGDHGPVSYRNLILRPVKD